MSTRSLQGRTAIVTGGGSGIGGAVTRLFVARGARVVIVDLDEEAGRSIADELGDAVVFLRGDVGDRKVADTAVATAVDRFGSLDVLVNNASVSRQKPFEEQTDDDWDLAMNTGLYATRNFMLAALPELKKTGNASIVNFGSGAGLNGQPNQASYAAAKEAIRGLSRVAANEWAPHNIRVNVVCPMALTAGVAQWAEARPEQYAQSAASVPLGRFGDPERDVAPIVAFLASDDAQYMTGQTVMADGGAVKLR
ncbi:SDR family NAD(P)-dependent oxidoreductase [Streptomyces coelicoflavus]|uniref:SDR family NAD(P)-dependent oxidoreductase n=1 Tax=Streptomyces TaxID=1883 RepID=UPI001291CB72|nr:MULTISPECIES: SDR family NAD(P)-dependent oxidoreductase [Streptomyces]MCX5039471.1 SDR family oxidoreductase [Streptomyces coelicoflavus]MDI6515313.1 SDR family NAD(P)-dependent oxidoreductase [Streptomyces coelicoflavus]QFX85465.1 SDR family oxidoreductase [Streptomyces sp. SYP-A7193]